MNQKSIKITIPFLGFVISFFALSCNIKDKSYTNDTSSENFNITSGQLTAKQKQVQAWFDSLMYEEIGKRRYKDSTFIHIYLGTYIEKQTSLYLSFDQGKFIYSKDTSYEIRNDSSKYLHLTKYQPVSEMVEVFYRVNEEDSTFLLDPKKHYKVVFSERSGELFYCTNLDYEACWIAR